MRKLSNYEQKTNFWSEDFDINLVKMFFYPLEVESAPIN